MKKHKAFAPGQKTIAKRCKGFLTAAYLIQAGIEKLSQSPDMRNQLRISLADLQQAAKVRRQLLKMSQHGNNSQSTKN